MRDGWRLSNTMDPQLCPDALNEALGRFQAPSIFNTNQGAQFPASAWTSSACGEAMGVISSGLLPGGYGDDENTPDQFRFAA